MAVLPILTWVSSDLIEYSYLARNAPVTQAFSPINPAKTFIMLEHRRKAIWWSKMHDPNTLKFLWRWLLGGCSSIVTILFAHIHGQYSD